MLPHGGLVNIQGLSLLSFESKEIMEPEGRRKVTMKELVSIHMCCVVVSLIESYILQPMELSWWLSG